MGRRFLRHADENHAAEQPNGERCAKEINMLDYTESKLAYRNYEARVRSFTPIHDYEDRLRDDRLLSVWPVRSGIADPREVNSGWLSTQIGRLFYATGSGLASAGEWIRQRGVERLNPRSQNRNGSVLG